MENTQTTKADKVLELFKEYKKLNGEQVVELYEAAYGRDTLSNSTHTTVSKLTKEGHLRKIEGASQTKAGKKVDLWILVEDAQAVIESLSTYESKKSPKQLKEEIALLQAEKSSLNKRVDDLIEKLEAARNEIELLQSKTR